MSIPHSGTPHKGPEYKLIQNASEGIEGIEIGDWHISSCKTMILNSEEIETWTKELAMKNFPEMIFGKNFLRLKHSSGMTLVFDTFGALKEVDHKSISQHKVSYANDWMTSKQSTMSDPTLSPDVTKIYEYDWTFSTTYKGSIENAKDFQLPTKCSSKIDTEMLKKPDPILYFCDVHLYEDELGDNGIALMSIKMRVMPTCFFVLMRFWMRIDNVLFRINDTRIFHELGSNHVLREYHSKEAPFQAVSQMIPYDASKYNDSNFILPFLKTKESYVEKIMLSQST